MAPPRKTETLNALLPATPCTPQMEQKIRKIAKHEGRSVAEIQRRAYALFLLSCDSNPLISPANLTELASLDA